MAEQHATPARSYCCCYFKSSTQMSAHVEKKCSGPAAKAETGSGACGTLPLAQCSVIMVAIHCLQDEF